MARARQPRQRYGIFVHEPDGDMGCGRIVGPFYDATKADAKGDAIARQAEGRGEYVECIVLPICDGATGVKNVVDEVVYP